MITYEEFKSEKKKEFQQKKLIDEILKKFNDSGGEEYKKLYEISIKNGICYMLSTEWLRLVINNDPKWKSEFLDEKIYSSKDLFYFKQIANNYYAYFYDTVKINNNICNDKDWIELCTKNKATIAQPDINASSYEELAEAMTNSKKFMSIKLKGVINEKKWGHLVSAYLEVPNTLNFFDPNYGIVQIVANSREDLKAKTKEIMRLIWNDYNPYLSIVMNVKVKND